LPEQVYAVQVAVTHARDKCASHEQAPTQLVSLEKDAVGRELVALRRQVSDLERELARRSEQS
jgi:hypothetical protein